MGAAFAALVVLAGMTILGACIEGVAAYRAYQRHQWRRRYVTRLKTTGLRRPSPFWLDADR